ncbi:hypothetical protein [Crocosphaera sp.]|uniref:hypothetical protein n=1 Tax=Crocosphaera sp. TaxID=2729996 RepID=UPI003F26D093|nr:hypothetical protein [Crocosphaera sp.]
MKEKRTITKLFTSLSLVTFVNIISGIVSESANAAIVNGSFETGLNGWMTGGVVSIENGSFGVTPTDGVNQALATTADGSLPTSVIDGLEDFLGVPLGIFDDPGDPFLGAATEGSALKQTFTAQAGDTLTLDWNFLTDDTVNPDYAFVILSPETELNNLTFDDLIKLSASDGLMGSASIFAEETGYGSFSASIPTDGTYLLGIGVIDAGDVIGDSGVLLDNVVLEQQPTSVPEGSSLISLGLLGACFLGQLGLRHLKQ